MAHHLLAIYDKPGDAVAAVDRLAAIGITQNEISVVASEGYGSQYLGIKTGTKGAEGTAAGGTIGGILGAIAASLVATGVVVTAGTGILVAGPIAAALAGAGAGGAAGGILGGLIGLGIPDAQVQCYDEAVGASRGMLLGVEISDANKDKVRDILKETGGKAISSE